MNAKKGNRKAAEARPPTIYDGDKYFDAKFTWDERLVLGDRIISECGMEDGFSGRAWLSSTTMNAMREISRTLGTSFDSCRLDWAYIHICRQLEIDYKSFAKNVPKLPIEPFYAFVEKRFPRLKATDNKMRLDVQKHHMHLAFIDWVDAECQRIACPKSYHGLGCEDRYEKPDYLTAVQRVWKHNAARPKLTLVHSD